jgi:hypothetical protein
LGFARLLVGWRRKGECAHLGVVRKYSAHCGIVGHGERSPARTLCWMNDSTCSSSHGMSRGDIPVRLQHAARKGGLRLRRRARRRRDASIVRMGAAATAAERIDHLNRVDFEGGLWTTATALAGTLPSINPGPSRELISVARDRLIKDGATLVGRPDQHGPALKRRGCCDVAGPRMGIQDGASLSSSCKRAAPQRIVCLLDNSGSRCGLRVEEETGAERRDWRYGQGGPSSDQTRWEAR